MLLSYWREWVGAMHRTLPLMRTRTVWKWDGEDFNSLFIFLIQLLLLYLYYNKLTITQYDIPNNIPNIDSIKLDFFKSNVFSKRVPRSFKSKTPYCRHHDGIITSSKFNLFCGNFGVQYTTLYRKYRINRHRPQ